jgi:L-ascorbate metabolism protein UlaG (beta-lactamase superfamily)
VDCLWYCFRVPIPIASTLDYLMRRRARQVNDVRTAAELNWRNFEIDLPPGLQLQWLGTAGFRFGYDGFELLIDPYLTRSSSGEVFSRRPLKPNERLIAEHLPAADAVLVGHTHFDHALDLPLLSRRTGCPVYGSRSLCHLMAICDLADRAVEVVFDKVYEIGPFEVTFVESAHSKLLLGLKVPFEGELTCDDPRRLSGREYRCGQVYGIHIAVAGATFYHQGSANLIEERIPYRSVDYLLAGISGRGFTRDYTARSLRALSPRIVVPHHYDEFYRPLGEEMKFSLNVNFGGFVEEVRAVSGEIAVRTLDMLQTVERAPVQSQDPSAIGART